MFKTASHNLTRVGVADGLVPQPATLVILGGGGDLAKRKLLPAIYNLRLDGLLPEKFAVVGFGRRELSDDGFRAFAREGIEKYSRRPLEAGEWPEFERSLFFMSGTFEDGKAFTALKKRLEEIDAELGLPGNRIFYLSIPPTLIEISVEQLRAAGLIAPPTAGGPFTRMIVEKPIGRDLESAREVNATLAAALDERQIFRIDHYLGKETVQNILVMRFGNAIFEPLWNQKYIDHVQITVAESIGVEHGRAAYYDRSGAMKDMLQNHMLQVLALVAMEPPISLDAEAVRDQKVQVLRGLTCPAPSEISRSLVRARYAAGKDGDQPVHGYLDELGVPEGSNTETYVAVRAEIEAWRWSGVPFLLRHGKRLAKRTTEVKVQFRTPPLHLFNRPQGLDDLEVREAIRNGTLCQIRPNVLTLTIQPEERISLSFGVKQPGPEMNMAAANLAFDYGEHFGEQTAPEIGRAHV